MFLTSSSCALGAVFRAALLAVGGAGGIERTADDVVANAREIFHTAAAHEHDRVLLQVMADAGDVRRHFLAVGQAHARDFAERRVRLLGGDGLHLSADAATLRVARHLKLTRRKIRMTRLRPGEDHAERAGLDLLFRLRPALTDQLVNGGQMRLPSNTHKVGRTCRWA